MNREQFLSMSGLKDCWGHVLQSGKASYATISTDLETGDLRVLFLRIKRREKNKFSVSCKYYFHDQTNRARPVNLLTFDVLEHGNEITIDKLQALDSFENSSDLASQLPFLKCLKQFTDSVIRRNEWINPVSLLQEAGYRDAIDAYGNLPGLYKGGEFQQSKNHISGMRFESVYPALFLHSILGVGPDRFQATPYQEHSHSISFHGDISASLQYQYKPGKTKAHIDVESFVIIHGGDSDTSQRLYKIKVRPLKQNPSYGEIRHLEYMGQKIDLSKNQAVASILKTIRNINRTIRAGDEAVIDDLKKPPQQRRYALPSELSLYTNSYEYLNKEPAIPQSGLMTFAAIGGNNLSSYISSADSQIGANQYILQYQYMSEDNKRQQESIMIDAGVLFHDIFDVTFFNASRYLHHRHNPSHVPQQPISAILFTHRHKDHLGQLSYLVKCGYDLPPLIMTEISVRQIQRDMNELNIDKETKKLILDRCYPVNFTTQINPNNPLSRIKTIINGTEIEQYTEVVQGHELNSYHYYPRLKIGSFDIRVGPMPHSDPGMMFDIITPAGSHRHTGDYKIDDSIKLRLPPLDIWLKAHEPDTLSADSTGATREGHNPKEQDVGRSIQQLLEQDSDRRFIFPMLGSNLARLTTLIDALGQTSRKILIVDGKAVEDLIRDADKVYGVKEWAKRVYDIDIFTRSQKAKVAPYIEDQSRDSEYALLVSGTQDEAFSSINRAVRDWLPHNRYSITENDTICFLQGVIPTGNNKFKRLNLQKGTELFFGARVILPELIERESDLFLHSSGHNNREDMKEIIRLSGLPFVIPVHGGPDQLQEHKKLAKEVGASADIIHGSQVMKIKKKSAKNIGHIGSDLIGITLHVPSKEKFYLKGRFSASVLKLQPYIDHPVAQALSDFERAARQDAGIDSDFEIKNIAPISLSQSFNAQTSNGYLNQNIPFGIERYHHGALVDKNIHVIAAFDTETGGLDASQYLIREFGMTVEDVDGNHLDSIQLFQHIPEYRIPSPQALLVTNTKPQELISGLPAHQFTYQMHKSIRDLKEKSYQIQKERDPLSSLKRNEVKALVIAHNARFDTRFLAQELARNLETDTRPHQTNGIITIDTRIISRALAAYTPDRYKVAINQETGFFDHSLKSLCDQNKIDYDDGASHGALYDTIPCMKLFHAQRDISPSIVDQLIINADSGTNHLLNDMMGIDLGFGGPHPVFTYVSPSAQKPDPQMGCFVGTVNSERYAIIFNLKYDPNQYLHLKTSEIYDLIKDHNNDIFEIIDLRGQPIILPSEFGFSVGAEGDVPREILDMRAGIVKRHINYIDPAQNWQNLAQKIDELWNVKGDEIFRSRIVKDYPNLETPLHSLGGQVAHIESAAFEMLKMKAKSGFNPVYQEIIKRIKLYVSAIQSDEEDTVSESYEHLMSLRKEMGNISDLINFTHYDIAPQDMSDIDCARVRSLRHYIGVQLYNRAKSELATLEKGTEYDSFIGDNPDKKVLFEEIKLWVNSLNNYSTLNNETQNFVRPWRSITRFDQGKTKLKPLPQVA
jgi:mRNA degradation ribonuclease J1/J2